MPLTGDVRAQVAIIGAGYTGLTAALYLGCGGRDVVVVDAVDVGDRASGLNGGQVIPGVKHDPDTLEEIFGPVAGMRLVDMVASRSRIILLPPDEKAAVLSEVRRLMATHPDLVGRTEYELPYITECTRADLPPA